MDDYNIDPFEEEEEEEDLIDRNVKIWSATDVEKCFKITLTDLSKKERMEIDLYLIDKYYPGSNNLSDDELVRQKYYPSLHTFQYAVSIKRMVEASGEGSVIAHPDGWMYGFGESL